MAYCIVGFGFKILTRTPVPKLTRVAPPPHPPHTITEDIKVYISSMNSIWIGLLSVKSSISIGWGFSKAGQRDWFDVCPTLCFCTVPNKDSLENRYIKTHINKNKYRPPIPVRLWGNNVVLTSVRRRDVTCSDVGTKLFPWPSGHWPIGIIGAGAISSQRSRYLAQTMVRYCPSRSIDIHWVTLGSSTWMRNIMQIPFEKKNKNIIHIQVISLYKSILNVPGGFRFLTNI